MQIDQFIALFDSNFALLQSFGMRILGDQDKFVNWSKALARGSLNHDQFVELVNYIRGDFPTETDCDDFITAYAPAENEPQLTPLMVYGTPFGDSVSDMTNSGDGITGTDMVMVCRPVGGGVYENYRVNANTFTNVTDHAWIRKTSAFNAQPFNKYVCDTAGGAFTVTLPANPDIGTEIEVVTVGSLQTENLTINRNGSTIDGLDANLVLDLAQPTKFKLVCTNTNEWRYY